MPIDYSKYHPSWHKISRFVRLIRAQNCCEECGVENYTVRLYCADQVQTKITGFPIYSEARQKADELLRDADGNAHGKDVFRSTVVVLTVAHLDHDIDNNELENLKALCQACHFSHDRRDNAQRRKYGSKGRFYNQTRLDL